MSSTFIILMVILVVIAAITGESFLFTLVYMLAGVVILGQLWSNRALSQVSMKRQFIQRLFPEETTMVRLEIFNQGWLPVIWLRVQDLLPIEISPSHSFQRVVSLGPRERITLTYPLSPSKRGYYPVGPLVLSSGDILGFQDERSRQGPADHLTVYPRVIPLREFGMPSRSPFGTLRHTQPIFEDPTRLARKRDYQRGDSLRRIDWKATAVLGRMQVKQYEPSIALETSIFLNLNLNEYDARGRFDATELAIVAAASLAAWVVQKKQSVGLVTNGSDPLGMGGKAQSLPPGKGHAHLMRVLETLARVNVSTDPRLVDMIRQQRVHLSWGTTLIVISGQVDDELFDEFFQVQRAGMNLILALCGQVPEIKTIQTRARRYGIPAYSLWNQLDLETLRG